MIFADFANAYRYRELIGQLTLRNIKAGRKQSMLGLSWIVLHPLALTAILTVFIIIAGLDTGQVPKPVFLFAGILTWGFLANATTVASTSVLNNANLITKTWFPRETLVYAATCSCLINLAVNIVVLAVMMVVFKLMGAPISTSIGALWLVPIVLIVALLAQGVGFLAASLSVVWRDVNSLLPLGLQVWFFATPIVYPLRTATEKLPEWALNWYLLNPMVGVVTSVRRVLLEGGAPEYDLLALGAVVSLLVFIVGFLFFKRCERHFADLI